MKSRGGAHGTPDQPRHHQKNTLHQKLALDKGRKWNQSVGSREQSFHEPGQRRRQGRSRSLGTGPVARWGTSRGDSVVRGRRSRRRASAPLGKQLRCAVADGFYARRRERRVAAALPGAAASAPPCGQRRPRSSAPPPPGRTHAVVCRAAALGPPLRRAPSSGTPCRMP